jgi:hypothetical protein
MNKLKLSLLFVLFAGLFVACTKEEGTSSSSEVYSELATTELQERSGTGFGGCFELVFPVSVKLPDGTTTKVNSTDELKTSLKNWKENHKKDSTRTRPTFVFPISVVKADGTIENVETEEELRELRKECPRSFGDRHGKGKHCFKLEFPYSIKKADGTVVVIKSADDLKGIRGDKTRGKREKPELVFPVTVTKTDGTKVTIKTKEELTALKESCK